MLVIIAFHSSSLLLWEAGTKEIVLWVPPIFCTPDLSVFGKSRPQPPWALVTHSILKSLTCCWLKQCQHLRLSPLACINRYTGSLNNHSANISSFWCWAWQWQRMPSRVRNSTWSPIRSRNNMHENKLSTNYLNAELEINLNVLNYLFYGRTLMIMSGCKVWGKDSAVVPLWCSEDNSMPEAHCHYLTKNNFNIINYLICNPSKMYL